MLAAVLIGVAEPGGLGLGTVLDLHPVADRQGHRLLRGEGPGLGAALDEGEGPVVPVEGHPQPQLFRRDLGEGVLHHPAHIGQGGHRHGRAVGIAPLIGHEEHPLHGGADGGVVVALI